MEYLTLYIFITKYQKGRILRYMYLYSTLVLNFERCLGVLVSFTLHYITGLRSSIAKTEPNPSVLSS